MKILLMCSAGMSTSMLVKKMEEVATAKGMEITVNAVAETSAREIWKEYDVLLLGPQVKFLETKIKDMVDGSVPVGVIDMIAYGTMNGEKVLNYALEILDNHNK